MSPRRASENLRRYSSDRVRFVAVEPAECAVLSGGRARLARIRSMVEELATSCHCGMIASLMRSSECLLMMPRP